MWKTFSWTQKTFSVCCCCCCCCCGSFNILFFAIILFKDAFNIITTGNVRRGWSINNLREKAKVQHNKRRQGGKRDEGLTALSAPNQTRLEKHGPCLSGSCPPPPYPPSPFSLSWDSMSWMRHKQDNKQVDKKEKVLEWKTDTRHLYNLKTFLCNISSMEQVRELRASFFSVHKWTWLLFCLSVSEIMFIPISISLSPFSHTSLCRPSAFFCQKNIWRKRKICPEKKPELLFSAHTHVYMRSPFRSETSFSETMTSRKIS